MALNSYGTDGILTIGPALEGGLDTAFLVAIDETGEPAVMMEATHEKARYVQLEGATATETFEFGAHPDGGAVMVGIDELANHPTDPGWYLQAYRMYFQGEEFVVEEPRVVKLPGRYEGMRLMADYVHLHVPNDNFNNTNLGFQIRRIRDLGLVLESDHDTAFGIDRAAGQSIYAHPYWHVKNTFFVAATKTGNHWQEWGVGMKILPDGSTVTFDLGGSPPELESNEMDRYWERFVNQWDNVWTAQIDDYATFAHGGTGWGDTSWDYKVHLVDEDGNVVEVTFPVMLPEFYTTSPSTFPTGIYPRMMSTSTSGGVTTVNWWGWASRHYSYGEPYLYKFGGTFEFPAGQPWTEITLTQADVTHGLPNLIPAEQFTSVIGPDPYDGVYYPEGWPSLHIRRGDYALFGYEFHWDDLQHYLAKGGEPYSVKPELVKTTYADWSHTYVGRYPMWAPYEPVAEFRGGLVGQRRAFINGR